MLISKAKLVSEPLVYLSQLYADPKWRGGGVNEPP